MLDIRPLDLGGVMELRPRKYGDERGFFSEIWSDAAMAEAGFDLAFVQDNHSYSAARGVLRGLHFQLPPAAQDKLVRVSRGAIYDVVVDIREGSASFGKWAGLVVSAELWNQVLIPRGFAHGFVTIEPDTEVQYKVTAPYRPDLERCIRFDDPGSGIDWPVAAGEVQLSAKDREAPFLRDVELGFVRR
jgi:dTDP-4-dehydrorhamnose 3,5-epimerase